MNLCILCIIQFKYNKIIMNCAVNGCTFCKPGQSHYCRVCRTLGSDHFAHDCPYKKYNFKELAKRALDCAEETCDIMWVNGERFTVNFWSNHNTVLFGLHSENKMFNASDYI